jgi:predicted RNase H-like HicB family nuclease
VSTPKDFIHVTTGLIIRVEEDTTGGYFALVPALPGCGSQGETVPEALENVNDALMVILDMIREEQPERYADLLGSVTVQEEAPSEPSSTRPAVEIVAAA